MSVKKQKTIFICHECEHQESKWLGRCPECGSWNAFQEKIFLAEKPSFLTNGLHTMQGQSFPLDALESQIEGRIDAGMAEVNRVLGGGIVLGGSVLIGGEPGIGKSTLLLQIATCLKSQDKVLYMSGEESAAQIKMRAERLELKGPNVEIFIERNVPALLNLLEKLNPILLIVDSIQTLYHPEAGDIPTTMNQLKYSCHKILSWVKERQMAVFLIAHVTKEGLLAGPKLIEHMVDTVLHFEQATSDLRFLRSTKNRFGSVDEIGIFTMDSMGLKEAVHPETLFFTRREGALPCGIAVSILFEGTRTFIVEIQALTVACKAGGVSRVFSDRLDSGRISRIAAVLEKHLGLRFSDQDIYINVAGGIRICDPGADLALALALYSARTKSSIPLHIASVGELSLAGEVRPVSYLRRRLKAAADLGFTQVIVPRSPVKNEEMEAESAEPLTVNLIQEVIKIIWKP